MKRAVVVSTNENDNYLFFLPILVWCWNRIGWDVICYVDFRKERKKNNLVQDALYLNKFNVHLIECPVIDGYKEETIFQCSRLYAGIERLDAFHRDYVLMVGDVDMIPLSDYWHPEQTKITCYGSDLSDTHIPMCYVAMAASKWREVMKLKGMLYWDLKRDLDEHKEQSTNKEYWWCIDQQILTDKLKSYENEIVHIPRGKSIHSDYPVGRIDRSAWIATHKENVRIDCHMPRPGYSFDHWPMILNEIIHNFNPSQEDITWMENYRDQYTKLL